MDYFLSQADQKINYWESKWQWENPHNPRNMVAEFDIRIIDDG